MNEQNIKGRVMIFAAQLKGCRSDLANSDVLTFLKDQGADAGDISCLRYYMDEVLKLAIGLPEAVTPIEELCGEG